MEGGRRGGGEQGREGGREGLTCVGPGRSRLALSTGGGLFGRKSEEKMARKGGREGGREAGEVGT